MWLDDDTKRINANIRRNIIANGFTLKEVGAALGVSPAAVTKALSSKMPIRRVWAMADYMGITVDELISDETELLSKDAIVEKCPHCGKYIQITTNTKVEIDKIGNL